ncbi:MAG: HAMP domain-containing sensor histidine kinase [Candidatus Omnitrophica bacterium]|nr:HAMP domain-containing sensor histidine kinase [Candidatus Omnitrophota bacterium]
MYINIGLGLLILFFVLLTLATVLLTLLGQEKINKKKLLSELDYMRRAYNEVEAQSKLLADTNLNFQRIQKELDKKLKALNTLYKITQTISNTFETDKILESLELEDIEELNFEKLAFFIFDESGKEVKIKKFTGYGDEEPQIPANAIDSIFSLKSPIYVGSNVHMPEGLKPLAEKLNLTSMIIVPLQIRDKNIGIMTIGNTKTYQKPSESDIEILSLLANQLVQSIENASLYEQLWKSYQDLEERVKERTRELEEANKELQKMDQVKTEFVSAVAHELRTPLTSIKGYATILSSGRLGKLKSEQEERLNRINKHSNELVNLINNLLDISRIKAGKTIMAIESVNLKDVVKDTEELISPQAEEARIEFRVRFDTDINSIMADKIQLERVLVNLLSNALKFTPQLGQIGLNISSEKDFVKFEVYDTGAGIEEKDIDKIFNEFFRADNAVNREKKGTGLGLSLVKQIVEAHSGEIWVESKLNKGSHFYFKLPINRKEKK